MFNKKRWAVLSGLALASVLAGFLSAAIFTESGFITGWWGKGSRNNTMEFAITSGASIGTANFVPGTDNINSLGTSSLRFSDMQTYDLTVADDLTVTDAVTVSGTLAAQNANVSIQLSTAPRTSSTIVMKSTGTLVWNTTGNQLCISSGTAQSTFVSVSTPTAACAN